MSYDKHLFRVLATITLMAASSAQNATAPASSPSSDQQPPANSIAAARQATPSDVTIKARAQVVLLDVVATDKRGQPVADLKREDFTILEQGKPQPIASFNLVDIAKRGPLPAQAAMRKLPPGVYSNLKADVADEPQLTVLLLDALNTPWAHQAYARYEMLKYLEKNHPAGQHTAVYALNTRLIRLQDFTDDPEVLKRAISKHKGGQSAMLPDNPDLAMPIAEGTPDNVVAAIQSFEEQEAAFQMDMRVTITLNALRAIGQQLTGYTGRKKLIWVSGTFPVSLDPGDNAGFASQRNYADDITQTTTLLRDAQVSVYPIDAAGLTTQPIFDASTSGRGRTGRLMTGPQFTAQMSRDSQMMAAAHMAAQQLADETGGIAFYNRNDLDTAIMKSVADGAVYYAISYRPENKNWDGKFRKIEIKLNRPGVELRYRKGYYAKNPEDVLDERETTARDEVNGAMNTVLTSSSVAFFASAFPLPAPKGSDAVQVAQLRFLVDPRDILFQKHEDRQHCSVRFVAAVFKGDSIFKGSDKSVECDLKPETYSKIMSDGLHFEMPVQVTDGRLRIRILVRDNLSGKIGSLDVPYPPVMTQSTPPSQPAKP